MKAIKASIIGLGRMGFCHAEALISSGCHIIAICDRDDDTVKKFHHHFKLSDCRSFKDPVNTLQSAKADLVIIATTADSHCYLTCIAAEYDAKFILCEKPMATSVSDCNRMIEVCKQFGSRLAINHQMRFLPQYTIIKEMLNNESFGRLGSMNVIGGCFGLSMNASHYIEAFHYLTDTRSHGVSAWLSNDKLKNPRGAIFKDRSGQVRILSENGQRLNIEIGSDQGHGMTVTYATRYGHIFVDELGGEILSVVRKKEYFDLPVTRYGMPVDRSMKKFTPLDNVGSTLPVLDSLLKGSNYPSGEDGREVVKTLISSYYSNDNNNIFVLNADESLDTNQKFPWA